MTANSVASLLNARGTASPVMKMKTVAINRLARSVAELVVCALAAHTNADHAHQISASTSIDSPNRVHVGSR